MKNKYPALLWILALPQSLQVAVWALISHGVDPDKLRPLLVKLKPGPRPKIKKSIGGGKRGRPVVNTAKFREDLLQFIYEVQNEIRLSNKGHRVSLKAALKQALNDYRTKKGLPRSWVTENLNPWYQQLLIARKQDR